MIRILHSPLPLVFALVTFVGCKTTTDTASAPTAPPAPRGAESYPLCTSQTDDTPQRAPSFFSKMAVCRPESTRPALELVTPAGSGRINDKGSCAFESGVTCHYHTAKEFLSEASEQQEQGVGELHCIVPTDDPQRPVVYGSQVKCRGAANSGGSAPPSGQCSSELMEVFSRCEQWRCCDRGTLTNPLVAQSAEMQGLTPDFRICTTPDLEVDCSLFAPMRGQPGNAPALGGEAQDWFLPGGADAGAD